MLVFFLNHDHVNQKSRSYDLLFTLNLEKKTTTKKKTNKQQRQQQYTSLNQASNGKHIAVADPGKGPAPPLFQGLDTPPPTRPLSEVLDTTLHSPYLHLEALKVQNSLSDNYNPPPPPLI